MNLRWWSEVLLFGLLFGCSQSQPIADSLPPAEPPLETLRSRPAQLASNQATHTFKTTAHKMGMPFEIKIFNVLNQADASLASQKAFEQITEVESLMSEWIETSEISRINRGAGKTSVKVSKSTFSVLKTAQALAARSAGAFDPTWAAFRGVWQFTPAAPLLPTVDQIKRATALVDFKALILDESAQSAYLKRPNMELGLGGIAKGYAIDLAAQTLRAQGYTSFMIDGGGDLFVGAPKTKTTPWRIGIKHPRRQNIMFGFVTAQSEAVVTSGDYEHYFKLARKRYHHIIDVRSGYPASKCVSVTVVSPSATLADALATAIFVLGPSKGVELLAHYPRTKILILASNGIVYGHPPKFAASFPRQWRSTAFDGKTQ